MDTSTRLKATMLFSELNEKEVTELERIVSVRQVAADTMLFFEGDQATGFFVLLTGQMRIFKSSPEGKEFTLHHITPGQMFAEAAIFRGNTYPANCMALEDSEVIHVPKKEFIALIKAHPNIAIKMIGRLSSWLREFTVKLENLSLKEVPGRLATYLLKEVQSDGDSLKLSVSKTELASELGTISETLSRTLRKLRDMDVIEVRGNDIKILDRNRLQEIAEGRKI